MDFFILSILIFLLITALVILFLKIDPINFGCNINYISNLFCIFLITPFIYFIIFDNYFSSQIIYLKYPNDKYPFIYLGFISLNVFFLLLLKIRIEHEKANKNKKVKKLLNINLPTIIFNFVISVHFSLMLFHLINYIFDFSTEKKEFVTVINKEIYETTASTGGKINNTRTVYYYRIYLSPIIGGIEYLQVSKKFYNEINIDDKFIFYINKGALSYPFISKKERIDRKEIYKNELEKNLKTIIPTIFENLVECPSGIICTYNEDIEIETFYIGKYEVTEKEFQTIMGIYPYRITGENHPVTSVSYEAALEFCDKLNELAESSIPEGFKFNLPTENQWDYACTAGISNRLDYEEFSLYCFPPTDSSLKEMAWYDKNSSNRIHPVGQKKPNSWGIYDMQGNAEEWCIGKVSHGGSFCKHFFECFPIRRNTHDVNNYFSSQKRKDQYGFRIALVPID